MSYTNGVDKPVNFHQTETWSSQDTSIDTINFAPDWVWIKSRTNADTQVIFDTVRGANKRLSSSGSGAESTTSDELTAFNSDGYTLGTGSNVNRSGHNYVSWNWLAGGTAPAITYSVKVVSDSGNKYRFDDFGASAQTLDLQEGGTYTFDQSDSSNSGHPLRFSTTSDGSHGGGSEYTTGVTTTGTPGSAGAKTVITVASGAATLYYYCSSHSGMGGQANTNSTHGSSNFDGTIKSKVTTSSESGFSIVTYTGSGTDSDTVGHNLADTPDIIFLKKYDGADVWYVMHKNLTANNSLWLNSSNAQMTTSLLTYGVLSTSPTSSVFSFAAGGGAVPTGNVNNSGSNYVAYCFAEKKGYSKIGRYFSNNSSNGAFVYTGFLPSFVMIKNINGARDWRIYDNQRDGYNNKNDYLEPNTNDAESNTDSGSNWDFCANGFKFYTSESEINGGLGNEYMFMAFAENPFVTSTGIPTTVRT